MNKIKALWWIISILILNAYPVYNVLINDWDNTDIIYLFWLEATALILITVLWFVVLVYKKQRSSIELLKLLFAVILLWPVSTYLVFSWFSESNINWIWLSIITTIFIFNEFLLLNKAKTNQEKFYIFKVQSYIRFGIVIGVAAFLSFIATAWDIKESTAALLLLIFLRTAGDIWLWAVQRLNNTEKMYKRSEFPKATT